MIKGKEHAATMLLAHECKCQKQDQRPGKEADKVCGSFQLSLPWFPQFTDKLTIMAVLSPLSRQTTQSSACQVLPQDLVFEANLLVHLGVPVTVKHDDCVSSLQIEAQPACSGGQSKDEIVGVLLVEVYQH